jgi:murein DD-endopeptidase MepM/ murein hydrolase activator NlpD
MEDKKPTKQDKANGLASSSGYKDFMSMPLMSKLAKGVLGGNTKAKFEQDPNYSKVGPSNKQKDIKKKESQADILAKTFNLIQEQYFYKKSKIEDTKEYQKKLHEQKEKFLKETIQILSPDKTTGKALKPGKMGRVATKSKLGGSLKFGLKTAAVLGGLFIAKDSLASIDWKKELGDFDFKDYDFGDIQSKIQGLAGYKSPDAETTGAAMGGEKAGDWKNDAEFLKKVNDYAKEKDMKASDLLAVMASESGISASAVNEKSGATGLIQFTKETAKGLGTSTDELAKMSRSDQFEYVKKYLDSGVGPKLKKGATAGDVYAKVYLPARSGNETLATEGENYYEANKGLDVNKEGKITKQGLQKRADLKKQEFNIQDVQNTGMGELKTLKDTDISSGRGHRHVLGKAGFHEGIDIKGKEGDPVTAVKSGTIISVGASGDYGNLIRIDHGDGVETRYAHLSKMDVKVGDIVSKGQKIGAVGSTGRSTGPHLHYEVLKGGKKIDPDSMKELYVNPVVPDYKVASTPQSTSSPGTTIISSVSNNIKGGTIIQKRSQSPSNPPALDGYYN